MSFGMRNIYLARGVEFFYFFFVFRCRDYLLGGGVGLSELRYKRCGGF